MAREIELKLAVPERSLRRASRLPWLRKLANGPAIRQKLVSVYFDTRKFKLRDNGLTLRIRNVGGKRVQTVKANTNGSAAASGRDEWEKEIASDEPDLKQLKGTALEPMARPKFRKSLRAVFETDVRRIAMPIRLGKSEIEVAFDSGRIRTGARSEQISEIELELKRGDPADLARLSERISRSIPAAYCARSKAERGYALSASEHDKPVRAEEIVIAPTASTGDAFLVIGLSCLHHIAANEDALRHGETEGVHQMRVGLRRLRAAISVFKDLVQADDTEKIKAELKWLSEQLGPARDFDVFVKEGVAPLRKAAPRQPELGLLEADLSEKRDKGLRVAKVAVTSERYRNAVLKTALWIIDGEWSRNADPLVAARRNRPVTAFAQEVLGQRTRKTVKKLKKLETLDALHRHRLRIAAKKLRYTTDFFASLFSKAKARKARRRFEKVLKALQDALGKLNDISVHERMARQFAHPDRKSKKKTEKAYAIGLLAGREKHLARLCFADAAKAGRQLSEAQSFWQ